MPCAVAWIRVVSWHCESLLVRVFSTYHLVTPYFVLARKTTLKRVITYFLAKISLRNRYNIQYTWAKFSARTTMKQQHQSCSIRQAAHKLKYRTPVEAGPKKLQSWTKVLGHFCISGVFSNSHRPNPSLTHKQRWTRVSRVFFFPSFNVV